jgi:hypothetical protein
MKRCPPLLLALLALAACVDTVGTRTVDPDDMDSGLDGGDDARADSSADGGLTDADAAPVCTCSGAQPVCLADGGCAECTQDNAQACTGAKPLCGPSNTCVSCTASNVGACTGATPVCESQSNTCVACNVDPDCAEATPACGLPQHTCGKCTEDADCTRFGKVCDEAAGSCVACTIDSEAMQCGNKSCDPAKKMCTQTVRTTVQQCNACVADSECVADHRCIEMFFGTGVTRVSLGGRCMKRHATGCAFPYGGDPINRQSLSGAAAENYCGLAESRTTCEAIRKLEQGTNCSVGGDQACGVPGAICRRVNGVDDLCTYACGVSAECPAEISCPPGIGNDKYCGKN